MGSEKGTGAPLTNIEEPTHRANPFAIATWLSNPWAMLPDAFYALAAVAKAGAESFADAKSDLVAQTDDEYIANRPQIRIVPAYGVLLPRQNLSMESMGLGTSLPGIVSAMRAAAEDPRVEHIILDVDSPGGPVAGVMEAARELEEIRAATDVPITAMSRYVCASSAYWIACAAADKIVASPSSLTGSIGVFSIHIDRSSAYEQEGLKVSLISAGKYKTELADTVELSDGARAGMQAKADYYYSAFLEAVAEARGASPREISAAYGEGRVLTAGDSLQANLVDEIKSIDQYLVQARENGRTRASEPVDVAAILDQALTKRTTRKEVV